LAGANLIYGLGMLDMGCTVSYEQLLMDCDFAEMIKYCLKGIEVNDRTLSLDIIHEVNFSSDFLSHRDTFQNRRIQSSPTLIDRRLRARWVESGGMGMVERAKAKAQDLLDNYIPEPLPEETLKRIREIINEAEEEFGLPLTNINSYY
jgi:trimethylamine--corrinoid protein Co-methyltransferase